MDYFTLLEQKSSGVLYHGTSSEDAAKSIMRDGIKAPDLEGTRNTSLRPVIGRVYATPHLPYAMIYGLGGAGVFGQPSYQVPYEGNEDKFDRYIKSEGKGKGRYGYVFVMSREDLQGDVQPDEDSIGQLYYMYLNDGPSQYSDPDDEKVYRALEDDGTLHKVMYAISNIATPNMTSKVKDGDYSWFARLGKKVISHRLFTDDVKQALLDAGTHVAHEGTIIPSQVWRFDKAKAGWIKKDGSNFFEIAERIR